MRKFVSFVLILTMVLSGAVFAFAFDDVSADNQELTNAAGLLNELGIVQGYEDGSFRPEREVTRAEMAKMMILAMGHEPLSEEAPTAFSDCQGHWGEGYISSAAELGIVNGVGNGRFAPDTTVSSDQALTMMVRSLGYNDLAVNGGSSTAYSAAAYRQVATDLGIYALDATPVASLARDNAAIMLKNSLFCSPVTINAQGLVTPIYTEEDPSILAPVILKERFGKTDAEAEIILKEYPVSPVGTTEPTAEPLPETPTVTPNAGRGSDDDDDDDDSPYYVDSNYFISVADLTAGHKVDVAPYLYQSVQASLYTGTTRIASITKSNVTVYTGALEKCSESELVRVVLADKTTKDLAVTSGGAIGWTGVPVYWNNTEQHLTAEGIYGLVTGEAKFVTDSSGSRLAGVVYGQPVATEIHYGVLTNVANARDGKGNEIKELTVLVNGKNKTYQTADVSQVLVSYPAVVELAVNRNNQVEAIEPYSGTSIMNASVTTVSSTNLVLEGSVDKKYYAKDYAVYKNVAPGKSVSVGDLADVVFAKGEASCTVDLYINDNKEIFAIVINQK